MRRPPRREAALACGLLLAVVLFAPSADALFGPRPPSPLPGDNGMDTPLGSLRMPLRPPGDNVHELQATAVLKGDPAVDAARYMFAFVSDDPSLQVRLDRLQLEDGAPLPLDRDERTPHGRDPRVFVLAGDMPPPGTPIRLEGEASAEPPGRHQVGALVVAFRTDWTKADSSDGEIAQLYAYAFVTGAGGPEGPFDAPLHGLGNVVPYVGLLALGVLPPAAILAAPWLRRALRQARPNS